MGCNEESMRKPCKDLIYCLKWRKTPISNRYFYYYRLTLCHHRDGLVRYRIKYILWTLCKKKKSPYKKQLLHFVINHLILLSDKCQSLILYYKVHWVVTLLVCEVHVHVYVVQFWCMASLGTLVCRRNFCVHWLEQGLDILEYKKHKDNSRYRDINL